MNTNGRIPNSPGIYHIVLEDGRGYVGQTSSLSRRLGEHRKNLRTNSRKNPKLQDAWNAHGESAFTFYALETLDTSLSKADLDDWLNGREGWWILNADSTWNAAPFGGPSTRGIKYDDAYKAACRERRKNQPPPMLGRIMNEEARRNMSEGGKGKIITAAHRAAIGNAVRGIPRTDEWRANLADAQTGNYQTHCKRGHEMSGDNLMLLGKSEQRGCRACRNLTQLAHRLGITMVEMDFLLGLASTSGDVSQTYSPVTALLAVMA